MYQVITFYHFVRFQDLVSLQRSLRETCRNERTKGTILLAHEGINGTIGGSESGVTRVLEEIRTFPGCQNVSWRTSWSSRLPFNRMKVRLKQEIVSMGRPNGELSMRTGHYVASVDWNEFCHDPDTVMIDTRNHYEVTIGTFVGAINPKIKSFREFPEWWENQGHLFMDKKIAMFCTGGIRCEKSTHYLVQRGIEDVYHLKGGILKYLEDVPKEDSLWQGSCFVFDDRVSVDYGLIEGPHILCHGCRAPLSPEDTKRPEYEPGVSCHHCISETSDDDKERFRERQKQITLARARGQTHLGD
ncbi:MAG: rhodanese-related sulfurtransferase [Aestuariivita sp.]|nr:rhodanese-related sulfurtransferase [Aestuariivita sp.]